MRLAVPQDVVGESHRVAVIAETGEHGARAGNLVCRLSHERAIQALDDVS